MTRESPGLALTVTFVAGLAIGGLIALAASRKDQKRKPNRGPAYLSVGYA